MKIEFGKILTHAEEKLQRQPGVTTEEHLKLFKNFYKVESKRLKMWHRYGASGFEVAKGRAHLVDAIVTSVYKIADEEYREKETSPVSPLTILALGGYGRQEMNPFSDVDIMFVYPKTLDKYVDFMTQKILYMLWDVGLLVGHSVRSLFEAVKWGKEDLTSKTAMLESRFLTGDTNLFYQFKKAMEQQVIPVHKQLYVETKLEEVIKRHQAHGNSASVLEPDVKEGTGGLRDLHALLWIAQIFHGIQGFSELQEKNILTQKEFRTFQHTYDFLLRVRAELHFVVNKKIDILSLEYQPSVAEGLGYKDNGSVPAVEVFMKEYFIRTREVQQTVLHCAKKWVNQHNLFYRLWRAVAGRKKGRDGFLFRKGEIYAEKEDVFQEDPLRLIRVFRHSQKTKCPLSEELKDLVRNYLNLIDKKFQSSPESSAAFLNVLSRPGKISFALRAMHETGVLGKYLPEFGRINCMVQYDFYHKFTTDEHTLKLIDNLDLIVNKENKRPKPYLEVFEQIKNVPLLYLSLLLHDIGKGLGGGHSHKGALMSEKVSDRLGLTSDQKESLYMLVEHHLTMAQLSQRRDINDDKLISIFAGIVKNRQNLMMLHLLTFCDSSGTGSGVWTKWKEELLWQFYGRTLRELTEGPRTAEQEILEVKQKQWEFIKQSNSKIAESEILDHFKYVPDRYSIYTPFEEISTHIKLVEKFKKEKIAIEWTQTSLGYSIVNVCTTDRPGLFSQIAGALSLNHINILSAQINTRSDDVILDSFYVSDMNFKSLPADPWKERFSETLLKVLNNEINLKEKLQIELEKIEKRKKKIGPDLLPKVKFDNFVSEQYTVVDIQSEDRLGFLYTISSAISALELSIFFAKISTEKTQAYDVFYVGDKLGKKIDSEDTLVVIKEALERELTQKRAQI